VYASTTGESSIIAPDGALIEHSGIWQRAILDARVPLVSYRTLADRVGAWPEYVIIALTVLALAWALLRPRRKRAGTRNAAQTPEGTRSPGHEGGGTPGREGTGTEPTQAAPEPI
jgi:apolipoprotein N-acyltransferase